MAIIGDCPKIKGGRVNKMGVPRPGRGVFPCIRRGDLLDWCNGGSRLGALTDRSLHGGFLRQRVSVKALDCQGKAPSRSKEGG